MPRFFIWLVLLFSISCGVLASSGSSGPAAGSTAPDFKAHDFLTGEVIPLGSLRGKVVILAFWNSWCGSCRRELPLLERAQTSIGQEKLTVLAVSFQEDPSAADAIGKMASAWHIKMIEDNDSVIAKRYGISTIPYLFIIGRDGTILANHVGYGDRTLAELLKDINHALAGKLRNSDQLPRGVPGDAR